jgi:hypothetical protein
MEGRLSNQVSSRRHVVQDVIGQHPVEGGVAKRQRRDVGDDERDVMAALVACGPCFLDRICEHVAGHYPRRLEALNQRPGEATPSGAGVQYVGLARD